MGLKCIRCGDVSGLPGPFDASSAGRCPYCGQTLRGDGRLNAASKEITCSECRATFSDNGSSLQQCPACGVSLYVRRY